MALLVSEPDGKVVVLGLDGQMEAGLGTNSWLNVLLFNVSTFQFEIESFSTFLLLTDLHA